MIRHNGIEIDRARAIITHRGIKKHFKNSGWRKYGGGMFAIWENLLLQELPLSELFDRLYGDREDGGPERGLNHLRVRLAQFKPMFAVMGLRLSKDKRGGVVYMRLVPVDVV